MSTNTASNAEEGSPDESAGIDPLAPRPIDFDSPQLTIRAVLTGTILGAVLSICNVYTGLKIGWGTNMSITGILLAYAAWAGMRTASRGRIRPFTILENNINQAACSAAAAVSSAGLVAPIPALTLITGETFSWPVLSLWVFAVCLVGITVATGLRRQMIIVDQIAFPSGIACAATLKEIYGQGQEAIRRVTMMGGAAVVAGAVKVATIKKALAAHYDIPFLTVGGEPAARYTLSLEPNLLMVGVGGLIGIRAAVSLLLGAILAWAVIGPRIVETGAARLRASETLLALPQGVTFEPRDRMEYQAARQRLTFGGRMSDEHYERFAAKSDDPAYRETLSKLRLESNHRFVGGAAPTDYTTTRPGRFSVPLDSMGGFVIPAEYASELAFVRAEKDEDGKPKDVNRLVTWKPLTEGSLRGVIAAARLQAEIDQENPDAVIDAVQALYDRGTQPAALSTYTVPESLASKVSLIEGGRAIRTSGVLIIDKKDKTKDELEMLLAGVSDPDLKATLASLSEGSQFSPPVANFTDLVEWLLWPGVTLMVVSSLVAFSFSWKSMMRSFTGRKSVVGEPVVDTGEVTRKWFIFGLAVALILAVTLQMLFFEIMWYAAISGVLLSFVLAVVASRVSGETNTTPVGAMGKVTQLVFGLMVPNSAAANLMTANVTGGAASQCADLMHDFKCGYLLGAVARKQAVGQIAGALGGSILGSLFYLILIPDPKAMLMTAEWPAPAVATWKAVADLFAIGIEALPAGTPTAIAIAAILGIILPVLDRTAPKSVKPWIPSASALGLAFVINGFNAVSMFIGALIVLIATKLFPRWSDRFIVTICAGIIAGESLTGAADAVRLVLQG